LGEEYSEHLRQREEPGFSGTYTKAQT